MSDSDKPDSNQPSRKRLGKGLAALIGDMDTIAPVSARPDSSNSDRASGTNRIAIDRIGANPHNPRREFAEDELADLASSIREHGVMQPIIVRRDPGGAPDRYEIIAGERRWRASQRAGLHEVPVLIRDVDDKASLELAIVENVQRSDLNSVEEALGYQRLIDEHDYTQNDLAQVIGKSRSHVANTLRLLRLPKEVLDYVADGRLSAGHARTLVGAENPGKIAAAIVSQGLSVRQAEKLAQSNSDADSPNSKRSSTGQNSGQIKEKNPDILYLEKALEAKLGLKVSIDPKSEEKGNLTISYGSLEQLDAVLRSLQVDF
jgi:ParB family chromosome partitioning protein